MDKKINVLVVDDSALIRKVIPELLKPIPQINEISTASDPIFAEKKMDFLWPDVIVLDVEMPRMDGITFLKKIMAKRPTPVIIFSTLTPKGANTSFQALTSGAFEVLSKPKLNIQDSIKRMGAELIEAVLCAANSNLKNLKSHNKTKNLSEKTSSSVTRLSETTQKVVAIGTSTGGTIALVDVLTRLKTDCPGIAIVQHMPEGFTASFAKRLNQLCDIEVREAKHLDKMEKGLALLARGNYHLQLKMSGAYYHVEVIEGPLVSRHRPSVNILFRSFAKQAQKNALGIIMTGMGDDGAAGLLEMHDSGAKTIAQDKESCVVYGMPNEAVKKGAVDKIIPLENIAKEIMQFA